MTVDVKEGEKVVISIDHDAVAHTVPTLGAPKKRLFGALVGKVTADETFFDALPDNESSAWEQCDQRF